MKKVALLLLVIAISMLAQGNRAWNETLTATGTTKTYYMDATNHTVQVYVTGSPSGCAYQLEGSEDNSHFDNLSGSQTCVSGINTVHVDGKVIAYVRVNLTAFAGATSAAFYYRGKN